MTIDDGREGPPDRDRNRSRGKTLAAIASIAVAVVGLLSSPAWGPPICQAVRVCTANNGPEPTTSGPMTPANTIGPTSDTSSPSTSPTARDKGSGYPYFAGDYCNEFVRAWQDHYEDRASDLSNAQIAATVFKIIPPGHYRNDWGPTGNGAMCTILDTDRGNAQVIQLFVTKQTGQPGAITSVKF